MQVVDFYQLRLNLAMLDLSEDVVHIAGEQPRIASNIAVILAHSAIREGWGRRASHRQSVHLPVISVVRGHDNIARRDLCQLNERVLVY